MIPLESEIEGTLKPDGTLELDQIPNLRPGRVKVLLRQAPELHSPIENWWESMKRSRRKLGATGTQFVNDSDIKGAH